MPLVSQLYPPEQRGLIFSAVHASDELHGLVVNPATGDVTIDKAMQRINMIGGMVWDVLGALDVASQQQAAGQAAQLAQAQLDIDTLRIQIGSLQTSIEMLIGFFGVTIPAWINKEEVENGDDMGMVRLSAANLGLIVEYRIEQATPGFENEQVVSITPPAGSLVARGSKVEVAISLTG